MNVELVNKLLSLKEEIKNSEEYKNYQIANEKLSNSYDLYLKKERLNELKNNYEKYIKDNNEKCKEAKKIQKEYLKLNKEYYDDEIVKEYMKAYKELKEIYNFIDENLIYIFDVDIESNK